MRLVPKLYPIISAKNLIIPLQPVSLQSCRSEQITPACTTEKSSESLRNYNGTSPKLPSKPALFWLLTSKQHH